MPRKTATNMMKRQNPRSRFNEAAARCHGKPWRSAAGCRPAESFNEAAARCHGKPGSSGMSDAASTRLQ